MDKIKQVNFFTNNAIKKAEGGFSLESDNMNVKSFKDTVIDMMGALNDVTNKPNKLAKDAMQGKADVADVMAAVAQAEMSVQAATTVTGKILQTYEKIMQIQI